MHCIIVRENCPERYFVEVIGPFDTYAEASEMASFLEHSRYNISRDGRKNSYHPTTMVKPEEA